MKCWTNQIMENASLPIGTKVLVTLSVDKDGSQFWQNASQVSLDAVWDNPEDDIYKELPKI